MKNKHIIVLGIAVLVLIIAIALLSNKQKGSDIPDLLANQVVSLDEPLDVVTDFYESWLNTLATGDPYQSELVNEPLLSQQLRDTLQSSSLAAEGEKDRVICQNPLPEKVNAKILYEQPEEVQFTVFSKTQRLAGQAVVTTRFVNDGWYIASIECSREFDEPGEFTFEQDGNLLKSVPPPYDPSVWHLVYEQNGVNGYVVPLSFSGDTICSDTDGTESTCDQNNFVDAQKVTVRGDMTEAGLDVKIVEYRN